MWHVIVLNILTLSAYSLIWFYKNVKDLSEAARERSNSEPDGDTGSGSEKTADIVQNQADKAALTLKSFAKSSPILRTLGLLLPVLQLYLIGRFFKECAELNPDRDSLPGKHPLIAAIVLTSLMFGLFWLYKLPGAFFLLYLTASVPMAIAQSWLNKFWQQEEGSDLVVRHAFSVGELASIIAGSIVLGLVVVGFYVGR